MKRGPGLHLLFIGATLFGAPFAAGDMLIDDFSAGAVHLVARSPFQGGPPYAELIETHLPMSHVLNGQRMTWVVANVDSDPTIADLHDATMWFNVDNDGSQGGLKYDGLGGIDLTQAGQDNQLAFNLGYSGVPVEGEYVLAHLTLRDTAGRARALDQVLAERSPERGFFGVSGAYGFNLADWAPVDVTHVQDIELTFDGGPVFHNWFSVSNFTVVPEPAGLLLGLLLAVLRRR